MQSKSRSKTKIFDNEAVEELAVLFKRSHSAETFAKLAEMMDPLIQSILKTEQFPDWQDVRNFLFLQMERWIDRWVPGRGHLYAYIATSTKNAAVSYTTKAALYRQKVMGTDIPLEELGGVDADSHSLPFRGDLMPLIRERLLDVETRWHEPEIRSALKYCFLAILDGHCRASPSRNRVLKYLTFVEVARPDGTVYTLTREQSRHLLDYAQGAIRSIFLEIKVSDVAITPSDLLRMRYRFSKCADIEDVVGSDAASRLMVHFAGQTIKFPPVRACVNAKKQAAAFNQMVEGEGTPECHLDALAVRQLMIGEKLGSSLLFSEDDIDNIEGALQHHGAGE